MFTNASKETNKINLKYLYILTMIKLVNTILSLFSIIFVFIIFYSKDNIENFNPTTQTTTPCPTEKYITSMSSKIPSITNYSFCAKPLTFTFKDIKEVLEIDEASLHENINDDNKKNILSSLTPEILKNQSDTNYFYLIDQNTTIKIKYDSPKKNVFTIAFRIIPIDNIGSNELKLDFNSTENNINQKKELKQKEIYNIFIKINKDGNHYKYTNYIDDIETPINDKQTIGKIFDTITFKSISSKKYYLGDIMFVNEDIDIRMLMYDYKNPRENMRKYYNTCSKFNPFLKYNSDRNFYTYDECVNTCKQKCDNNGSLCQELCLDCNKFIWEDSKRKEHCPWLDDNKIGKILKNEIRANGGNKQISVNWFRPDSSKKITDYILVISEASGSSGDRIHKIKDNQDSNQQVFLIKNLLNNTNYKITIQAVVIDNNSIIMKGPPSDSLTITTIGDVEQDDSYIYDEDYSHLDEDLSCTSNLENHILDIYKPKDIDIEYSIKKFINRAREKSGYILQ